MISSLIESLSNPDRNHWSLGNQDLCISFLLLYNILNLNLSVKHSFIIIKFLFMRSPAGLNRGSLLGVSEGQSQDVKLD